MREANNVLNIKVGLAIVLIGRTLAIYGVGDNDFGEVLRWDSIVFFVALQVGIESGLVEEAPKTNSAVLGTGSIVAYVVHLLEARRRD